VDFKAKQFDQGLFKATDFIALTLAKNSGALAVKDGAGYFKADAVLAANRDIQALRQKQNVDVVIETFPTVPADKKEAFAKLEPGDDKGRARLFADWQAERVKATGSPAIHVLISKEPQRVELAVNESSQKSFSPADQQQLRALLAMQLASNAADQALVQA